MNAPIPPADDRRPQPDPAEYNAFFPSPHSLSQFTSPRSDLSGADYPRPYRGGRWKILMLAADERYLQMANGTFFSTGNHPIETLLPMYHLDRAGFAFEVATLSGNPVKFEHWAFPQEDAEVRAIHEKYLTQFRQPAQLEDVLSKGLDGDSDYLAVFIPGGHAALIGLPHSPQVKAVLQWALQNDRFIISLCHGPAALLAAGLDESAENYPLRGYSICAFPDSLDRQTPALGYMPGDMPWFMGEKLKALGVTIVNDDIAGHTHQDRRVITGDSPFASNKLGQLAAQALLDYMQGE